MVQSISTNTFAVSPIIVSADPTQGTHTTITSALSSAVSGQTIFLRDGTYTENITGKAGVVLTALLGDAAEPNVTIIGKCTFAVAGTFTIANIRLQTNSDFFLVNSGSAASIVYLTNCFLNCTNNTGISYTTANTSSSIICTGCNGDLRTTGISLFADSSTGTQEHINCFYNNTGASLTTSTKSAGNLALFYCFISNSITSSSAGVIIFEYSSIETPSLNITALTHNSTAAGCSINKCYFNTGSASGISLGAGSVVVIADCTISSTNTNAIDGSGTMFNAGVFFSNTSSLINATVTQTARNLDVGGISFNGGANVLSNFVSKTSFTPVLAFGGASTGITYSSQVGFYTRIGNMVSFAIHIILTNKGSSTGAATITGLPLACANDGNVYTWPMVIGSATVATATYFYSNMAAGSSTINVDFGTATSGGANVLADTNFANNTSIDITGFYFV